MSGIIGLLRTDGAAIEGELVRALLALLGGHGPDRQGAWSEGPAALGHTLLRTGPESDIDRQPLTLDGRVWIVANARVDARADLVAELGLEQPQGTVPAPGLSDAELILRAYLKWGGRCVDHLLGDFAFAVWDRAAQRLFCARDHLGVKPFYYAHVGPWVLFSSALECLRRHPAVSDQLDDLAIADFLLFGLGQDAARTAFRHIKRLSPAHTLEWSSAGLDVRPYWTLPIEEPIRYRRDREYVDRFLELLRQAVADRLRTERVCIFMSGGLDSSMLVATAAALVDRTTISDPIHAFTFVHETLMRGAERRYAGMCGERFSIPIHYFVGDELVQWPCRLAMDTPEPVASVDRTPDLRCYAEMAAHSRVAFYGEGPDNALLYEWRPYLAYLVRRRQWRRLIADAGKFLVYHRRVPLIPTIPRMLRSRREWKQFNPVFPRWMAPELIDRLRLRDRWLDVNAQPRSPHPVRPKAYTSFDAALWQPVFEFFEPSYTGVPLEVRHPYVDLRLLRFLLRVPVVPWCREKLLLRCALRGLVPERIRVRPKSQVRGNADYERVRHYGLPALHRTPRLAAYGSVEMLAQASPNTIAAVEADLRFVALSHWLRAALDGSKEVCQQGSGDAVNGVPDSDK